MTGVLLHIHNIIYMQLIGGGDRVTIQRHNTQYVDTLLSTVSSSIIHTPRTCCLDVEGKPVQEGVADQLAEEESQRVFNHTLEK